MEHSKMSGHYPSEQTLKMIRKYDITKNSVKTIVELIQGEWEYADMGYFKIYTRKDKVYVQLHTAGWSGNEDIYREFERIHWIGLFWQKSVRGGHYYYEFPKSVWENGINSQMQEKPRGDEFGRTARYG